MRINFGPLIFYGCIEVNQKIIDLTKFEIRDAISPEFLREKSLECARKILKDPYFEDKIFLEAAELCYRKIKNDTKFRVTSVPLCHPRKRDLVPGCDYVKVDGEWRYTISVPTHESHEEAIASVYHETIHVYLNSYRVITDYDYFFERVESDLVRYARRMVEKIRDGKRLEKYDFVGDKYRQVAEYLEKHGSPCEEYTCEDILERYAALCLDEILTVKLTEYYLDMECYLD